MSEDSWYRVLVVNLVFYSELRRMKKTVATVLLSFCALLSVAQYGNEWINYDQTYFKFKTAKDGIYRLNYKALINAGMPLSTIDPRNIQIFHNGVEQFIWVEGEADGKFDSTDYIELFCTYNDGKLDVPLFRTPADQTHDKYSIYQDSTVYFVTWTKSVKAKRYTLNTDTDFSGMTPDPWFTHNSSLYFTNQWLDGLPYADLGYFAEYTTGEGYHSSNITSARTYQVLTPFYYSFGFQPKVRITGYSASNPTQYDGDGNNHEFLCQVVNGAIKTPLFSHKHRGYNKIEYNNLAVPKTYIQSTTRFEFSSIYGGKGRHVVSYIEVEYPRKFDLGNSAQLMLSKSAGNRFYQFANYSAALTRPIVYDLTSGTRCKATLTSNTLRFKTVDALSGKIFIADSTTAVAIGKLEKVVFNNFPVGTDHNYLILSHTSLQSGAEEYKKYRSSMEGGSNDVLLAYADKLYDEFYFGLHHPMAIKNWLNYIASIQPQKPTYLLLLGKALMYINFRNNDDLRKNVDLVPTMGWPPTDYLFSSPMDQSDMNFWIETGRIPATTNEKVLSYLDKVKDYEKYPQTSKRILQLAGGIDQGQNVTFVNYLNNFQKIIEADSFGGEVTRYSKLSSITIDETLIEKITTTVNEGVNLVNYFGHGAAAVTEIDFGKAKNYGNYQKYPIYFFDGCILGNSMDNVPPLMDEFLFEPNRGAVGWIAGTFYGYTNELYNITHAFHLNAFRTHYGSSIGKIMQETISDYQNVKNNYSVTHCRIMVLHGDPFIKIYSPSSPDYTVSANSLELKYDLSNKDTATVQFQLQNLGKVTKDSVPYLIRIHNNGKTLYTDTTMALPFGNKSLQKVKVAKSVLRPGINSIEVVIDFGNEISELLPFGETNNVATKDEFVIQDKLEILSPQPNEIITSTNLKLQFTNYKFPAKPINFQISLDTTPRFDGLKTHHSFASTTDILHVFDIALPPIDSTDFYIRIVDQDNKDTAYSTVAFIYQSTTGMSEGYWSKFNASDLREVTIDESSRAFKFRRSVSDNVTIETSGTGVVYGGGQQYGLPIYFGSIRHMPGIFVFAVNPDDETRFCENNAFNIKNTTQWWPVTNPYYVVGGYSCLYRFNTNLASHRDSLVAFLNRIPDGYYLGFMNETTTGIANWPDTLFKTLELFGAAQIRNVQENHPYILWGQKGTAPGMASELMSDTTNKITPPKNQIISLTKNVYPLKTSGVVQSNEFGPASKWRKAWITESHDHIADSFFIQVVGITADNREVLLITGAMNEKEVDLSLIDWRIYPKIRLRVTTTDLVARTPLQLLRWAVQYQGIPEGFAYTEITKEDTVDEGSSYKFSNVFRNISEYNMDTVTVSISHQVEGNLLETKTLKLKSLNAGDTLHQNEQIAVMRSPGNNSYLTSFNPNALQPEVTLANNLVKQPVYVRPNSLTSTLQVYFDNQQILNRQVINPNAKVAILGQSNHKTMLVEDPNLYFVYFIKKGATNGDSVLWSRGNVQFTAETPGVASKFEFTFENLDAGIYIFLARLQSPTSAENSTDTEYTIEFEVSEKNEMTEVVPYPNPMINQCRFAYSYGGRTLPEKYHLSIFNINGKLVREVSQEEFGALQFGSQLSQFVFDGKDNFGDQLANGVYLYRFEVLNADKKASAIDQYMVNGFGKIYISR